MLSLRVFCDQPNVANIFTVNGLRRAVNERPHCPQMQQIRPNPLLEQRVRLLENRGSTLLEDSNLRIGFQLS